MANNAQNQTKKDNSVKKRTIVIGIIGIIVIIILLLLRSCSGKGNGPAEPTVSAKPGFELDQNATKGDLTQRSKEEIQEELNEQVRRGLLRMSMNTSPVFETGTSEGNLLIVNKETNYYPQIVVIELDNEEHTEIYRSGAIPVGSKVEMAKLDVPLEAGTYPCIAKFFNVDVEAGTYLGQGNANIVITVLH